jgi:biotin carboxyl carrier protein
MSDQRRQDPQGAETTVPPASDERVATPTPEAFLGELVSAQCQTAPADAGAIVRLPVAGGSGESEVLALHPPTRRGQSMPAWLSNAVRAATEGPTDPATVRVIDFDGGESFAGAPAASLVIVPLGVSGGARVVGMYLVRGPAHAISLIVQRLRLSSGLVETFGLRQELQAHDERLRTLRRVVDCVAALGEHGRFSPALMALCNTLGEHWACSRVSIGLVSGRLVKLEATSHTEKLVRKTRLGQDIEAAMEEAADQDLEVRWPVQANETVIARAHGDLSDRQGSACILSLPLRRPVEGAVATVLGVITLEREAGPAFTAAEVESLRLLGELVAGRIASLDRHGRWLGPRLIGDLRDAAAVLVGPRHTWVKLAVLGIIAATLFLTFVKGTYRVEGTFRLEASQKRIIPAPFDGYIREVFVEVGDALTEPGAKLARLDDTELRLQLAAEQAELSSHQRDVAVAQRERKEAEAQIARAKADQSAAKAALLEHQIKQATLTAPEAGLVLSGDLQRLRGAPVRTGDTLFEVAPIDALRADLYVPEDRVADVNPGQRGQLATAAFPDRRIGFTVERIDPAAELRQEKNVFRARLVLDERPDWLRPGMEGLARVDIDKRPYGTIWLRRAVDWVRMRLWL